MTKSIMTFFVPYCLCLYTGISQENDSIIPPDMKIKVNREYDEKGNHISYDSAYNYFSADRNQSDKKIDSIIKHFFSDRESMRFQDSFEMPEFKFYSIFPSEFERRDSILRQGFEYHQKTL